MVPTRFAPTFRSVRDWWHVLVLAFLARVLYWVLVTPDWRPDADADQYVRLGRSLADGTGFSLVFPGLELHATAFRPPLYSLLLTPLNIVFGEALWPARLLNIGLGVLVVLLVAILTTRVGGRRAGLFAGIAVALYPPLVANDTVTLTEPLALALLLACILSVDDSRWVFAGISLGGLLLTRPNGYLVVLVVATWAGARLGAKRGLAVAGIALLVLAPWLVRNRIQVGTWRLTTSDGFTLAAMWGTPAQEAGTFVDPVFSPAYDDLDHRLAQFDEAGWNDKLTAEAISAIRENPGYLTHLVPRNVGGYFELTPEINRYPEMNDGRRWGFRQLMLPVFYVVTILGLIGTVTALRDPRMRVLVLIVGQFVALSLVLVAPPRLRAPFDLLMCIGFGLLVSRFVEARSDGRSAADDDGPSII